MNARGTLVAGIAIGLVVAGLGAAAYLQWSARVPPVAAQVAAPPVTDAVAPPAVATVAPVVAPERSAVPTTPTYERRTPRLGRPIFRCRANGVTTYSNEGCPDGSLVDGSSAVAGYDTRPSDRLARLVADGRAASAAVPLQPSYASPRARPIAPDDACANLARQVADIDAELLRPQPASVLDEWRQRRTDIRTDMARRRC